MFLYRADYLKYDFIPMNKRIRRVYGQNLNDTVCVVDPVMRGLGVDLDAVARIQAVFAAVQIYGQDTLQNVDKFFTVVLIHLKLVFRACGGRRHQVEDTRKTGKSLCISIDQVLYDLGVDLGTVWVPVISSDTSGLSVRPEKETVQLPASVTVCSLT